MEEVCSLFFIIFGVVFVFESLISSGVLDEVFALEFDVSSGIFDFGELVLSGPLDEETVLGSDTFSETLGFESLFDKFEETLGSLIPLDEVESLDLTFSVFVGILLSRLVLHRSYLGVRSASVSHYHG